MVGGWGDVRASPDSKQQRHLPERTLYSEISKRDHIGGKLLVWDATCPNTFVPSYSSHATLAAAEVAELAEKRKCTKYNSLPVTHLFTPVAIETSGA